MNDRRKPGMTLIELLVVIGIIGLLMALLLPAVQMAREAGRRTKCMNNLKQMGIALQTYQTTFTVYPFGVGMGPRGPVDAFSSPMTRRFSLHSQLLPYVEQNNVYEILDFSVGAFFPDSSGDPLAVTGAGPNEDAAQVTIPTFLCPSDSNRLRRPWGPNNYRSCNGNTWSGRAGNGMFGQATAIRPADVRDGLSNSAALSERILGDDDDGHVDMDSDLFGLDSPWTEATLRDWCLELTEAEAATLHIQDSNGGMTWLEGNMNWTRYNHLLPPGSPSCKGWMTWNGVAMTATSHHPGGVNLALGEASVRFASETVDADVWRALGSINGGETIGQGAF
ncbi:MAG TPA: DUF1559 domain-containing protein [Thermoguttaceae bacterium]|nr:DUF1559 domain-containing protein [Thermoguttaceae bacterium]